MPTDNRYSMMKAGGADRLQTMIFGPAVSELPLCDAASSSIFGLDHWTSGGPVWINLGRSSPTSVPSHPFTIFLS